ncbi:MAG: hypothetical protein ACPHID_01300 [Thermoplasmatota archaeon]
MRWVLMLSLVALSGCVSELLQETQDTVRNHMCAMRDPEVRVELVLHGIDHVAAAEAALDALAEAVDKDRTLFSVSTEQAPEDVEAWFEEVVRLDGDQLFLHVLPGEDPLVDLWRPGILLLADVDQETARILLMHGLGHAFGVVNAGTPFNDTVTEGREGPQHHEPSPRSVMHAGWHHHETRPETDANYTSYSAAIQDDWRAAEVCP